jgi:hypothetical protein
MTDSIRPITAPIRPVTHFIRPVSIPCPETVLTECISCGVAVYWAVLLFLPVHLFRTNPAFRDLHKVGPEWQWGCFAALVAAAHLAGFALRRPIFRWLGLCFGFGFLCGLVVYFLEACPYYHGIPINTGVGAYSVMAITDFLAMVWLSANVLIDHATAHQRRELLRQKKQIKIAHKGN